jgi:hypothetical protein
VSALIADDLSLLTSADLVPRQLIEDPLKAGAEPGVQVLNQGNGVPAPPGLPAAPPVNGKPVSVNGAKT